MLTLMVMLTVTIKTLTRCTLTLSHIILTLMLTVTLMTRIQQSSVVYTYIRHVSHAHAVYIRHTYLTHTSHIPVHCVMYAQGCTSNSLLLIKLLTNSLLLKQITNSKNSRVHNTTFLGADSVTHEHTTTQSANLNYLVDVFLYSSLQQLDLFLIFNSLK